jgi:hypothetical protein
MNAEATSNPEESRAESPYPEPPPLSIKGLFLPFGPIRKPPSVGRRLWKSLSDTKWKAAWLAVQMYRDSVHWEGKPWPGWEAFERDLAFQFAVLLSLLNALPQGGSLGSACSSCSLTA